MISTKISDKANKILNKIKKTKGINKLTYASESIIKNYSQEQNCEKVGKLGEKSK